MSVTIATALSNVTMVAGAIEEVVSLQQILGSTDDEQLFVSSVPISIGGSDGYINARIASSRNKSVRRGLLSVNYEYVNSAGIAKNITINTTFIGDISPDDEAYLFAAGQFTARMLYNDSGAIAKATIRGLAL